MKLWRSVAVDAVDDAKIDEYLEKQGIFQECSLWAIKIAQLSEIQNQVDAYLTICCPSHDVTLI